MSFETVGAGRFFLCETGVVDRRLLRTSGCAANGVWDLARPRVYIRQ